MANSKKILKIKLRIFPDGTSEQTEKAIDVPWMDDLANRGALHIMANEIGDERGFRCFADFNLAKFTEEGARKKFKNDLHEWITKKMEHYSNLNEKLKLYTEE